MISITESVRRLRAVMALLTSMEPGATAIVRGVLLCRCRHGERFAFLGQSWSLGEAATYLARGVVSSLLFPLTSALLLRAAVVG